MNYISFFLCLTLGFSSSAYELNNSQLSGYDLVESSKEYISRLYSCKRPMNNCTTQEKLALAEIEGKTVPVAELNEVLKQDAEKGKFIPLNLSDAELLAIAAATSLGIVVFNHDQQISDTVSSNKSSVSNTLQNVGNFLGESAIFPIAAGSYFLGLYYKDNRLMQAGLFTVGASAAMGIVTLGVKYATGRMRPSTGQGPDKFWEFGHHSFYSGHTAQAFTIATVFAELYKEDYPVVPYVAYGLASITAYARVYGQNHWASDVLVGAIAGHLITKWTMSRYKNFMIYPAYDRRTGTYKIEMSWTPQAQNEPLACRHIENQLARVSACIDEALNKARGGRYPIEGVYRFGSF